METVQTFMDIFAEHIQDPELLEVFGTAVVEGMDPGVSRNFLTVTLRFERFVAFEWLRRAETAIDVALCLKGSEIVPRYPAEAFSPECLPTLTALLRRENTVVNGMLDSADMTIDGGMLTARSPGVKLLEGLGVGRMLEQLIAQVFGCRAAVRLEEKVKSADKTDSSAEVW
ncbi:MAG: hypothetical protein FWE80_07685, partial [Oscillospiraceae bacterium]|nr:hypothetical protein [Oscillospiraceae bacterium]